MNSDPRPATAGTVTTPRRHRRSPHHFHRSDQRTTGSYCTITTSGVSAAWSGETVLTPASFAALQCFPNPAIPETALFKVPPFSGGKRERVSGYTSAGSCLAVAMSCPSCDDVGTCARPNTRCTKFFDQKCILRALCARAHRSTGRVRTPHLSRASVADRCARGRLISLAAAAALLEAPGSSIVMPPRHATRPGQA